MYEDFFKTLRKEHAAIRTLLFRLRDADSAAKRINLLFDLQSRMVPHMISEEEVLYPRLRENDDEDIRQDALESIVEHNAARMILRDLTETSADDESFRAKVIVLADMVERHMDQEEDEIFDDVRQVLSENEATDLLERYTKSRERIRNLQTKPGLEWM